MLQLPHTGVTPDMLGDIQLAARRRRPRRGRARASTRREVPDEVARYVVAIVRHTRANPALELGASSRAAIHLLSASKAHARLDGRDHVTLEDVREVAPYVLTHRLITRGNGTSPEEVHPARRWTPEQERCQAEGRPGTHPTLNPSPPRAPAA